MLNSLEQLKQELILQKEAITSKGGTTIVANTNPSPSEITAGIKSIEMPDLSQTSATVDDVRMGKTFYSGDLFIKTGTMPQPYTDDILKGLFAYEKNRTNEETIYYHYPADATRVREYAFYKCPNKVEITLPTTITEISDYGFYSCPNFIITNINDLDKLTALGSYSLHSAKGIDHENLWPELLNIGTYSLTNTLRGQSTCINLPAVKTISSYAFYDTEQKIHLTHIDFSKIKVVTMNSYSFSNLVVDSDLNLPTSVQYINSYTFHKGSFNNVRFLSTIKTIGDHIFGSLNTDPKDTYQIKTISFEAETPPTFGTNFVSTNHVENGLKIYVPDTAVDEYKAVARLAPYVDIILPMSQKP